jgi:hypothetical protein
MVETFKDEKETSGAVAGFFFIFERGTPYFAYSPPLSIIIFTPNASLPQQGKYTC